MKHKLLINIAFLILISCNKSEKCEVSGNLYFKLVDFVNYYNFNKEQIISFEKYLSDIKNKKNISNEEKKIINYYKLLKKNNLVNLPNFKILNSKNEILTIFIDNEKFKEISKFKLDFLLNENKKIELKLEVIKYNSDIFFCNKILKISELKGETKWTK